MNNNNSGFYGLGIAPNILAVLDRSHFTVPTPIQEKSIPQAIEGKDLVGIAQTGTGKTLAFGIPLIQHILKTGRGHGLILLPTRELAEQVDEMLRKIGEPLGIKTAVLIGGEPIGRQHRALARRPQVIIATPGRLIDHLEQRTVSLKEISILVLDEADRMLDMGFAPQLKRILVHLPTERQTMLFSATMPESIISMTRAFLKLPVRVEIAHSGTAAKNVTQELFFVIQSEKPRLLEKILQEYRGSVLVFCRTKFAAKKIALTIRAMGHTGVEFHSNRSLNQRREALDGFRNGRYRILVATDIAARGIDVSNIELVINYDLPTIAEDYVHRIGRTGRAGESGHAISFARPDQKSDVYAIERLMRSSLPVSQLPTLPPARAMAAPEREFAPRPGLRRFGSSNARPNFPQRPPFRGGPRRPGQPHYPHRGSR
jgi:ATP-dependent RNA helicase RhlE